MRVLQLHRLGMSMAHFNFNVRPQIRQLCAATSTNYCSTEKDPIPNTSSSSSSSSVSVAPPKKTNKALTPPTPKIRSSKDSDQLKLNWLSSLSLTNHPSNSNSNSCSCSSSSSSSQWVIGIDPDVSGALALFRPLHSPQVFDSPHLKLLVGKRTRRRLDPKAIIQLLQSFHAPIGTIAYLEQSLPYPRDGKQGWWSGGFNYGLWIGALVALGFSVVPVPSLLWKNQFRLAGNGSSKDDSREAARTLFPSISSQLTRKKDHGRAEALLIAAYGIGLRMSSCSPLVSEDTPLNLE